MSYDVNTAHDYYLADQGKTIDDHCETCKHYLLHTGSSFPDDPPSACCAKGHFEFSWPGMPWGDEECPDKEIKQ